MAKGIRGRSRRNRKREADETFVPMPDKPDDVRHAVISLYASACLGLAFLVTNGDVQLAEFRAAGLDLGVAALIHTGAACVLDGLLGFGLSRALVWTRPFIVACAGLSLVCAAIFFSTLIVSSPGFFITRLICLFMELLAVFLLFRPSSREWFVRLGERRRLMAADK